MNGWSSSAKVEVPVIAYGLGGSDTLRGGATQCILYGGPGVDVLIGTAGDDYLDPGEGVATVFGYGGATSSSCGSSTLGTPDSKNGSSRT